VVKNFRKYQRPKMPSAPLIEVDTYLAGVIDLAVSDARFPKATPALPQHLPHPTEIAPLMEDGGDKVEGKDGKKEYRFSGRALRLTAKDFEQWERSFPSIHDLAAELTRIDASLSSKGEKNCFAAASAMLNHKHQKNLEAEKSGKPRASPDGYVPMGNSG
jgi:hypothetical protein